MKYITINDLTDTIKKNLWKIPNDVDVIIGIPRSGMLCASIIASYLNIPLIDVNSFANGMQPWGGSRVHYFDASHKKTNKVLVIDDTVFTGRAIKRAKKDLEGVKDVEFIYACVYLEGKGEDVIDFYLEDVRMYTNNFSELVLYEWNIFQHHIGLMSSSLYDLDGVLCSNCEDIENAPALFTPRTKIGGIVTYRLLKDADKVKAWLEKNEIRYGNLFMVNADSWEEVEKNGTTPEKFKTYCYRNDFKYKLFVEGSDEQASAMSKMTKKPIFCVESNKIYQ